MIQGEDHRVSSASRIQLAKLTEIRVVGKRIHPRGAAEIYRVHKGLSDLNRLAVEVQGERERAGGC